MARNYIVYHPRAGQPVISDHPTLEKHTLSEGLDNGNHLINIQTQMENVKNFQSALDGAMMSASVGYLKDMGDIYTQFRDAVKEPGAMEPKDIAFVNICCDEIMGYVKQLEHLEELYRDMKKDANFIAGQYRNFLKFRQETGYKI